METFKAGGPGGQNQNARNTGVRIRHAHSGAVGESREGRTQLINKKRAFVRMADSDRFQTWARFQALGIHEKITRRVDEMMKDIEIEYYDPRK